MKKDIAVAVIAIVVVLGLTYGVSAMRVPVPMQPTHPFSMESSVATIPAAAPGQPPAGKVIMRVNGEPVTEHEFAAAFSTMPAELQQQYNSEQGKQAFAEQFVNMKLLEQEARKLGLDRDPRIAGQLAANRTDLLASAAAQKLVPQASPQAIQKFYNANQQRLQTLDVSDIVIAYQGGIMPPRKGPAPDQQTAMNKALQIYQKLKEGMPFDQAAKQYSDDQQSAPRGGFLGPVAPGAFPPELDARVMSLKEGEISSPIPTQYGIFIFKAGARKTRPLEEVRERIEQRVRQQETMERVEALRKTAKVEFDPKVFPDAKNWSGNQPPRQRPGGRPPA